LQRTRLDELRPTADLRLTLPGRYPALLAQIEAHKQRLQAGGRAEIDEEEAAVSWYDSVYAPIAALIRRQDMLRDFPGRTPLDLYTWIAKYQEELAATLGWEVAPEIVAAELSRQHSPRLERVAARVGEKLRDVLTPDALESGPSSGLWRWQRDAAPGDRRLFAQILAPVTGQEEHWFALNQALQIARREGGQVVGLHVVARKSDLESPTVHNLRAQFFDRCAKSGIPARFDVAAGPVARVICERSRFADLTVIRLVHPPAPNPIARLSSGIRTMLHRCPGPLLITPRSWHMLARPLLAFNGSDKAREALFVTAYLSQRWHLRPVVLAAAPTAADDLLAEARAYLQARGVEAEYVQSRRAIGGAVLAAAAAHERDLIILGGYSRAPLGEAARDSTVNALLRASRVPLLICR
jgi:nucleotide-binding universal stress UspA family protein